MTTIPLADLNGIMVRYDDYWGGKTDPDAGLVRKYATDLRAEPERWYADQAAEDAYRRDCAEADELDALIARVEAEAA